MSFLRNFLKLYKNGLPRLTKLPQEITVIQCARSLINMKLQSIELPQRFFNLQPMINYINYERFGVRNFASKKGDDESCKKLGVKGKSKKKKQGGTSCGKMPSYPCKTVKKSCSSKKKKPSPCGKPSKEDKCGKKKKSCDDQMSIVKPPSCKQSKDEKASTCKKEKSCKSKKSSSSCGKEKSSCSKKSTCKPSKTCKKSKSSCGKQKSSCKKQDPCKKKKSCDDPCGKSKSSCGEKKSSCKKKSSCGSDDPCKKKKSCDDPCGKSKSKCGDEKSSCKKKSPCGDNKSACDSLPCSSANKKPCQATCQKKKKKDPCDCEDKCKPTKCDFSPFVLKNQDVDVVKDLKDEDAYNTDECYCKEVEEYFCDEYKNKEYHKTHKYTFHDAFHYTKPMRTDADEDC